MPAQLQDGPFDPWAVLADYSKRLGAKAGATASFVGTLRDFNQGQAVRGVWLEHYPAMTQKYLDDLVADATARWPLLDMLVIHRFGYIDVGEPIVLVAAFAAHRQAAFDACREVMEALKKNAPFWKREDTASGPRWVLPEGER